MVHGALNVVATTKVCSKKSLDLKSAQEYVLKMVTLITKSRIKSTLSRRIRYVALTTKNG